ncbi:MAG: hypothetical protein KME43_16255 [Myxacorys chilensis ATA2-1-KO14]|jgi:hypothetical protein|nr:hypothetical protein [Myxacorys chilensis ATA2-1-KO14]
MPNPFQLIREQQASNRLSYARKQQALQESDDAKQQLTGQILGGNAEQGATMVQLDGGGIVPCQSVTSGGFKAGSAAIVTLNGSKAWVDGMPN